MCSWMNTGWDIQGIEGRRGIAFLRQFGMFPLCWKLNPSPSGVLSSKFPQVPHTYAYRVVRSREVFGRELGADPRAEGPGHRGVHGRAATLQRLGSSSPGLLNPALLHRGFQEEGDCGAKPVNLQVFFQDCWEQIGVGTAGPGVGLEDPCGSVPAQDILQFSDLGW